MIFHPDKFVKHLSEEFDKIKRTFVYQLKKKQMFIDYKKKKLVVSKEKKDFLIEIFNNK